jgi:hypothetical protein
MPSPARVTSREASLAEWWGAGWTGVIDLVLLFTVLEAAILILWSRRAGRGLSPTVVWRMLLPGICLMLALREALAGRAWPFVPLALTAALIAHLADLKGRWRG